MRQKKRNTTENETRHKRLHDFASLSEVEAQQSLIEKQSGKNEQMTNWSVSAFKDKLIFSALNW